MGGLVGRTSVGDSPGPRRPLRLLPLGPLSRRARPSLRPGRDPASSVRSPPRPSPSPLWRRTRSLLGSKDDSVEAVVPPTFTRGPSASLRSACTTAFRCAGLGIRRSLRGCAPRGLRRFPIGDTDGFGRFRDRAAEFDCATDARQQPGPLVFAGSASFRHKGSNEFYGRWPSIANKSPGSRVLWLPIFCLKLANSCTCAACLPIGTLDVDAILRSVPRI